MLRSRVKKQPDSAVAQLRLARALVERGAEPGSAEIQQALDGFSRAVDRLPDEAAPLIELGKPCDVSAAGNSHSSPGTSPAPGTSRPAGYVRSDACPETDRAIGRRLVTGGSHARGIGPLPNQGVPPNPVRARSDGASGGVTAGKTPAPNASTLERNGDPQALTHSLASNAACGEGRSPAFRDCDLLASDLNALLCSSEAREAGWDFELRFT